MISVPSLCAQGTPPLSLEKVKDDEIRNMIIHCTCVNKGQRLNTVDDCTHYSVMAGG